VVPFAAGGSADLIGRLLAQHLQQAFGTPFVVENRGGAGGSIGAGVVAKANGTVLLWADQNPSAGAAHINLFLPAAGGSIGLVRPDGSFIDRLTFGAQEVDLSAAREPDGSTNWVTEWNASPGAANPMGMGMGQPLTPQAASDPPDDDLNPLVRPPCGGWRASRGFPE